MTGTFIALEGADGVGKSTLAACLGSIDYATAVADLNVVPRHGVLVFVERRQISATSAYSATLMEHLATMLWNSGDARDLPDTFWVGMQVAWFTAHATTVVAPLLTAGYDVIVDGWVYKFLSKLLIQGYSPDELDTMFGRVPKPDGVVLLTTNIDALYERRSAQFRPSELGMHAGYPDLGRKTFVEYQQRGQDNLTRMADHFGWRTIALDPAAAVDECAATVMPAVEALCGNPLGHIRKARIQALEEML